MNDVLRPHVELVARHLRDGKVVPFLGAGVNLCGRPHGTGFEPGRYLPSGGELAGHLAECFAYPTPDSKDLVRISQYAAVMSGPAELYDALHRVFDADYPPSPVHRLLARVPSVVRLAPHPVFPLIVTTNYDDALERAFDEAGEDYDLVSYVAEGPHRGLFQHVRPGEPRRLITVPNEYLCLSPSIRPVILKIHGAVARGDPDGDSYVITEDHYIDYLTRTDISSLVPADLAAKLRRSHFLFLGYSLRDWNLRVILHRIWGSQQLKYKSWAVQLDPDAVDQQCWALRDVILVRARLEDYVEALEGALGLGADIGAPR